ncbi:MAG: hypothetical protein UW41_C0019G0002 [Candidatus Collierbacteria bacterium GW2011_GWC2_44_18]|uniref:Uncharacterized protein n=1 Tax=Candidatus Collierbacteria bacterium GW2011_GWC2_44_18 TaxID=1618392 RepID=A0A0G1JXY3_9BACT|nr:MAG: hypothetical protein UW41_C0019G0002 [Candidatus Collierbacteria bacterium GW2011_GWC2_44_18]
MKIKAFSVNIYVAVGVLFLVTSGVGFLYSPSIGPVLLVIAGIFGGLYLLDRFFIAK